VAAALKLTCSSFRVSVDEKQLITLELDDPHDSPSTDKSYDRKRCAERLGVTVRSVDSYTRRSKNPLPFSKPQGKPIFRESQIQRWLDDSEQNRPRRVSALIRER
jgi:DNA-directed RNA polymerase sigma subunit (sigma70/sigma32)